jgi:poly(3-hydroxybutyrate) depolymerase
MTMPRESLTLLRVAVIGLLVIGLSVAVAACSAGKRRAAAPDGAAAPGGAAGRDHSVTLVTPTDDRERHYTLFVPDRPAERPGLFVMLHGLSQTGALAEAATGLDVRAGQEGNYVAYPDGVATAWDAKICCVPAVALKVDDVAFVDAVITSVQDKYSIDAARIAVGGVSNGAMLAYRYACYGKTPVQSIVAVVGLASAADCAKPRVHRVLAINGLRDTTVRWDQPQTLPVYRGQQPPARNAITRFKGSLGCADPWQTSTDPATGNVTFKAAPCDAAGEIELHLAKLLEHAWPATADEVQKYGINATELVWDWLNRQWATLPS